MPRPKGSKVVLCKCGSRVVGMPGTTVPCPGCNRKHTIPKAEAKASAKKPAEKAAKKPTKATKKPAKKSAKK